MPDFASPDVRNISVGTGYIELKPDGEFDYRHIGNVPKLEIRIRTKTLDHFAPINGIKVRDFSWTVEMAVEIEIEMEEITAQNLQMIMLGDVTEAGGQTTVGIVARNSPSFALRYTATNEVGPRWFIDLLSVTFNEDGNYDPLTSGRNDFNTISVKGAALAVGGTFGVMTLI